MKKIFLSITLVLAFSIVACKNNSNSETPKEMTPQKQITKNKETKKQRIRETNKQINKETNKHRNI